MSKVSEFFGKLFGKVKENALGAAILGMLSAFINVDELAEKKAESLARQYEVDISDPVAKEYFTKGMSVTVLYIIREVKELMNIK